MSRRIKIGSLVLLDIVLLNLSLILAYLIRYDFSYTSIPREFLVHYFVFSIASIIIKLVIFGIFKLYQSLWRYAGAYELVSVVVAAFISNAILFAYTFVAVHVSSGIIIIACLLDIFMIGGSRLAYRIYRRTIHRAISGKTERRVLIIGAGDGGANMVKELKMHPEQKYNPVAIIDDDNRKAGMKLNGVPVVGRRNDITSVVKDYKIDEIIIAIPSIKSKDVREIYNECAKSHCKIKILPSVSELVDEKVSIQRIREVNIEDLLGREPICLDISDISNFIQNKVVVVTGGGGSIGSELCRQIASYTPKKLIILDNYENNAYDIQNELLYLYPTLNLSTVICNVREKLRVDRIFNEHRPNVVFHAAAHKHVPLMENNPCEAIKNNIFGTVNVAECSDKYQVERFVLISTDKAVNPTNIMGASKRVAEMFIQALNSQSKTEFVAVRFGNVLGSNGSVIPLFKKQIEQGGPVTVTHPEINRFFMTIPEAVQLVLQAGSMAKGGEIFVLDMGQPVKILDLAKNLIRLSG